ncbi:MAG: SDR family oxidoreductase [Deinococcales bacterium]
MKLNHDRSNEVAIVTGAAEGIGFAIAQGLAQQGAAVVLNDLRPDAAEEAAENIRQQGGRIIALAGDVAQKDHSYKLVAAAQQHFGKLSLAVANAGLTLWGDFFKYQEADFYRVVSVNLAGGFFLSQAAARMMRDQGQGGKILFTSSVVAHQAVKYLSAYAMTKAGLEQLARNLVIELSPHNITINTIAPGATITPRNLQDDPNYEDIWRKLIPLGKVAHPQDIANAALFLLSPAANHITGQSLIIDGGWSVISPMQPLDFIDKKS